MFRAWGFAVAIALCCACGSSTAHASKTRVIKTVGEALVAAHDMYHIKNWKLYHEPVRFWLPYGSFEQSEIDLWKPTLGGACALLATCRHYLMDERVPQSGNAP
jgi:hypothetical protein